MCDGWMEQWVALLMFHSSFTHCGWPDNTEVTIHGIILKRGVLCFVLCFRLWQLELTLVPACSSLWRRGCRPRWYALPKLLCETNWLVFWEMKMTATAVAQHDSVPIFSYNVRTFDCVVSCKLFCSLCVAVDRHVDRSRGGRVPYRHLCALPVP